MVDMARIMFKLRRLGKRRDGWQILAAFRRPGMPLHFLRVTSAARGPGLTGRFCTPLLLDIE
jgi:hypothetical protein